MGGLKRELGLMDVFAISTGAMFSSGFFLLPGLAAAMTGSSVHWAYGAAAFLILPAMLSKAELATAMPKAGGTYFYLDRAMGPAMGTVGGLGTWISLVLKSAFALIGMGAYVALLFDLNIRSVAVVLTVVFAVVNLVGAKETGGLQRILVFILLSGLGIWLLSAIVHVVGDPLAIKGDPMGTELLDGWGGFFASVGIVFVSYAGLTKVASVAEEIRDPGRAIPLGMALSLGAVTVVYMAGVWAMNMLLPPEAFHASLTPVADTGSIVLSWLPGVVATGVVVAAATAAFASTGNAGILASSRFPLAMARDNLLPSFFAKLNRFGTPTWGIVVTAAAMVVFIVVVPVATVAKLAGALKLLLFGLLCLAVIVMRSSGIDYYRPEFKSPFYPWVQIIGLIIPVVLIWQMGFAPMLFTSGLILLGAIWYVVYARRRTNRQGALLHVFRRLGQAADPGLDAELLDILGEREAKELIEVDRLIDNAVYVDVADTRAWSLIHKVSQNLADRCGLDGLEMAHTIVEELRIGLTLNLGDTILAHRQCSEIDAPLLAIGEVREAVHADTDELLRGAGVPDDVRRLAVLVSPMAAPDHHYRILAEVIGRLAPGAEEADDEETPLPLGAEERPPA